MPKLFRSSLLAAVLALMGTAPALALKDDDDSRSSAGFDVTRDEALEIAEAEGLESVREVKARRGVWKIEGSDADGVKLEIEIDGDTGRVVKVERYGMPNVDRSGASPN